MSGLFLLGMLGLWGWGCWWVAHRVCAGIERPIVRTAAQYLLFACLLPLPLADEIYSLSEFQRLCLARADLVVFNRQMSGNTVWYAGATKAARKVGQLQGVETRWTFVMAVTEEPAFQYTTLTVEGGWLMGKLGISETHAPLLFEGHCQPRNLEDRLRQLKVIVVDKPR